MGFPRLHWVKKNIPTVLNESRVLPFDVISHNETYEFVLNLSVISKATTMQRNMSFTFTSYHSMIPQLWQGCAAMLTKSSQRRYGVCGVHNLVFTRPEVSLLSKENNALAPRC